MPYVNIKLTGGNEAPTPEQKAALIQGVTDLLATTLGKNPATTVVIIEEVSQDNWGIGGLPVTTVRARKQEAARQGNSRPGSGQPATGGQLP